MFRPYSILYHSHEIHGDILFYLPFIYFSSHFIHESFFEKRKNQPIFIRKAEVNTQQFPNGLVVVPSARNPGLTVIIEHQHKAVVGAC